MGGEAEGRGSTWPGPTFSLVCTTPLLQRQAQFSLNLARSKYGVLVVYWPVENLSGISHGSVATHSRRGVVCCSVAAVLQRVCRVLGRTNFENRSALDNVTGGRIVAAYFRSH